MTSPAPCQPGDRIALVATDDPDTRLRPGDQGTVTRWDPAQGQLHIRRDSGSTLTMLPGDGDQVRLLTPAGSDDGTGPEGPLAARAAEPGRDAGRSAATGAFDGNTYRHVLRGIDEGDPAVLDAIEPSAIGPAAGYDPGRPRPRPRPGTRRPRPAPRHVRLRRRLHRQLLDGSRAGRPRAHPLEPRPALNYEAGEKGKTGSRKARVDKKVGVKDKLAQ